MSLKLVMQRLKSAYYRQVDGFRSDIELIRINAQIFHGEESAFAKCAEELEDDLLDNLPTDERDVDADEIITRMTPYPRIISAQQPVAASGGLRVRMRRSTRQ